jgi:predicted Fe-Mo cluster-binding NifX family protein
MAMADRMVLAVPSNGEGGLEAERSGHFGHCDCFTLIDVVDGNVADVRIVDNPPHGEGGCLAPVSILSSHGVTALLAAGMGARPLAGFADAGITVYFETVTPRVADAIELVLAGEAPAMDPSSACGGCH